ncbi:MAG TPA: Chromosome partitioning protein ParA [Hyphomicrobiaceae bacterium MAG_BT-2024]
MISTQKCCEKLRILAIANKKGGVGKTTTAINLGTSLASIGEHDLIIDSDPQDNASLGLGVTVPNLVVISETSDLISFEAEYLLKKNRAFRLHDAINELMDIQQNLDQQAPFSNILIDCLSSLSLLTLNALVATHAVIVSLQCRFFALKGLSKFNYITKQTRGALNPNLEIQGVMLTMYDKRTSLCKEV